MSAEAWLQGPIEGIPPLVMPVAHALVQARSDTAAAVGDLTAEQTWRRPGGAASTGFHVRHLSGSIDRLFTYARGEALNEAQRTALAGETTPPDPLTSAAPLLTDLDATIDRALSQLRRTEPSVLLEARAVGRARLPSTVIGLLFHTAEHSQRHVGQIVTTAKIVRGESDEADAARARRALLRLQRIHGGDPWHGASTRRIVSGFSADDAFLRPPGGVHSACEIVLHATGWAREVTRRLEGAAPALPADGDWPEAGEPTDARWEGVLRQFDEVTSRLVEAARSVSADKWSQVVGEGRDAPLAPA